MKDISIYFGDFGAKHSTYKENQLGNSIQVCNSEHYYLPEKNGVALIFVPEFRGATFDYQFDPHLLREKIYSLYKGNWNTEITDLGTILPGETIEDTYAALKEVVQELVKHTVFPIVIGGSQDLTLAVYRGYRFLEQTVNLLDIDASFDLGDPEDEISSEGWLNKIILEKPGYLFNYSLFGYQTYLVDPGEVDLLEKMYFDHFRLGEFYSNAKMVEPLVRNADILTFDANAVRQSDYRSNTEGYPHGLYGEDACRILRYAGWSDKLTSLGLFNICNRSSSDNHLLSQMIWYFIDGFNQRKRDYPIGTKKDYVKYIVSLDDFKDELVFYKSNKSARWWMEVPYPKIEGVKFQRHLMVPCDFEDYQNALKNEMPNLWWKTFKKLS